MSRLLRCCFSAAALKGWRPLSLLLPLLLLPLPLLSLLPLPMLPPPMLLLLLVLTHDAWQAALLLQHWRSP